jgi:hypothetical protein
MRIRFLTSLIVTVLASCGYFYYVAGSLCPAPLSYTIGSVDERFTMTSDEVAQAVAQAESIWEEATGRNLFTFEEGGGLTVNFIYDERQALSNSEDLLKEKLDATENVSDAMRDTYTTLVQKYNSERLLYTEKAKVYEARLLAYNQEVEKYNGRGGAPSDVYDALENEKRSLAREQAVINTYANKLNVRVTEINAVGEKANRIVNTYNQGVNVYNETFGTAREFTQGDYTNGIINIYTFDSEAELVLVLVHEMGHALSLDHVEHKESVMNAVLHGGKNGEILTMADVRLTPEDLASFESVCGKKTMLERLKVGFSKISEGL